MPTEKTPQKIDCQKQAQIWSAEECIADIRREIGRGKSVYFYQPNREPVQLSAEGLRVRGETVAEAFVRGQWVCLWRGVIRFALKKEGS